MILESVPYDRFLLPFVSVYFIVRELQDPIEDGLFPSLINIFRTLLQILPLPNQLVPSITPHYGRAREETVIAVEHYERSAELNNCSEEILLLILSFVDRAALRNLAQVSRDWYVLASADRFWRGYAIDRLRFIYLRSFESKAQGKITAELLIEKVYQASRYHSRIVSSSGFSLGSQGFKWKQFLATTRYCHARSGSGKAIAISSSEVKPHTILIFLQKLAEEKQPDFAVEILEKFLSVFRRSWTNTPSDSQGFVFRNRSACSVGEFRRIVESTPGLTVQALLYYFKDI